ncbi:hypothetical protein Scep_030271 [Stephania cephalantha]|uniref:Cupin type-1 domain-containing protein n=1 Tax=Stephania cephalantha TaxID=152367 RepID=A0AAP0DZ87_9MAGN
MAIMKRLPLFLLLSLLYVTVALSYSIDELFSNQRGDPEQELQQCIQQCQVTRMATQECERRCLQRYEEQRRGQGQDQQRHDPEREYRECRQQCRQAASRPEEQQQCEQWCEEQRSKGQGKDQQRHDPEREYRECRQQCQQQTRPEQQRQCEQWCEEQRKGQGQGQGQDQQRHDPEREYRECRQQCQQQTRPEQQRRCEQWCEEQRRGEGQGQDQQEREDHPYHFRRLQHYETRYRSEQGRFEVLQRFDRRSNLLKGLKDYRVAFLEARPNTVVLPHHCDAESIYFVAKGNGIVNLVRKEKRQSYNVRYGDIFKAQAGTIIYLVNNHEREDLWIVKLAVPVNTPGHFEDFFGAGGENPESFYKSFSQGILEAAFNVDYGRLQKVFQQSQGPMVRVSREQIQALSRHSSNANSWIFGSDRRGDEEEEPYRITKRKTESNQYGQLYEVRPDDYNPLKKLGITVSFKNITNGGMVGPYYNSIATTLAFVVDGTGYSEMVCPHLSSSSYERESQRGERGEGQEGSRGEGQGQRGVSYTRARSNLSIGDWFIIPAGHPVAIVSSANQNLQVLCFEVNSWTNEKIPLAGKNNALKQIEDVAAEVSFGSPVKEIKEIFNRQQNSFFYAGPESRQRGQGLFSII